jgi:hypothetical protein
MKIGMIPKSHEGKQMAGTVRIEFLITGQDGTTPLSNCQTAVGGFIDNPLQYARRAHPVKERLKRSRVRAASEQTGSVLDFIS